MVSPEIQKQNTHLREAIPPEQRLSVTLRYLATGESRRSLGFQYRISHNLISKIIPEVSSAIFTSLKQNYLKLPTTKEEWLAGRQAAAAFERLQVVGRGHGNEAKAVRDTLKSYFMERGKVSWQEQMALLH
ncbi:hypothetical protein Pcinc_007550 [Petrolisthes cinctipes]|uniref:Uncharacterized protein n=1 Tax=Petrolisthes cinctipes TaxID=88211 RepID=A0AAE1GAX2_PETCI|nr:hypothetical protein Pcinc_009352 [Petrolisthes cinctipes]KAK3888422.1 hypothetical protein Pcinc_007550 [Petrolisthes cinctipes]